MTLPERDFLIDLISFTKVRQHEQDTLTRHLHSDSVVDFAKGSKDAWVEIERLLGKRLEKLEEST